MDLWLNPGNTPRMGAGLCDNERSTAISYMLSTGYYELLYKVITSVVRVYLFIIINFLFKLTMASAQIVRIFASFS